MVEVLEVEGVVRVNMVDEEFLEPVIFNKVGLEPVPIVDSTTDEHLSE